MCQTCPCAVHRDADAANSCGKHLAGELIDARVGPAAAGARDRPCARRLAEPGGWLEALQASQQVAPVPGPALARLHAGQRLRRICLCLWRLSCGAALEERQVDEAVQRPLNAGWIHALLLWLVWLVQHICCIYMLHVHAQDLQGLIGHASFMCSLLDPCCRQSRTCSMTIQRRIHQHLPYSPKQGYLSCTIQNFGTREIRSGPETRLYDNSHKRLCLPASLLEAAKQASHPKLVNTQPCHTSSQAHTHASNRQPGSGGGRLGVHNAAEGQVHARGRHAGALGQRMHPVRLQHRLPRSGCRT